MNEKPELSHFEHVASERERINQIVSELRKYGASFIETEPRNAGVLAYTITFSFENSIEVTIRIELLDWQNDSDITITNITTLPREKTSKGFGTKVIDIIKQWASEQGFQKITATQVNNDKSAKFWGNNGFTKKEFEPPYDNYTGEDYIYEN